MAKAEQSTLETVLASFKLNKPVAIYGAKEGETDILCHAADMRPDLLQLMRKTAGGLISVVIPSRVAAILELPLMRDMLTRTTSSVLQRITSGSVHRSSLEAIPRFSIIIDARGTRTGISDFDRALTIATFAKVVTNCTGSKPIPQNNIKTDFTDRFYSPGHVGILIASPGLLAERSGHTELSMALCSLAGLDPVVVTCEMINSSSFHSCRYEEAMAITKRAGIPLANSADIIHAVGRSQSG